MVNLQAYHQLVDYCRANDVTLVAVSKLKPPADIMTLYELGQRDFGENYVQELLVKAEALPSDIRWHFIGHLQRNKVKQILPVAYLIHGVDSERLLAEINKEAGKSGKKAQVLLQMHIATEESKFGLDRPELDALMKKVQDGHFSNVMVKGLMGMASFSSNEDLLRQEFGLLKTAFDQYRNDTLEWLSAGMSGDYLLAAEYGSTHIRIGSTLFGARS